MPASMEPGRFAELTLELTGMIRRELDSDSGFRPSFLGHLLVEVLLDAHLIAEDPDRLEEYYGVMDRVDTNLVQQAVNRMARGHTERLAELIRGFTGHRVLSDYARDDKLFVRLNQVMRRVKCETLPESFCRILPEARRKVKLREEELLNGTIHLTIGGMLRKWTCDYPDTMAGTLFRQTVDQLHEEEKHENRDELVDVDRHSQRRDCCRFWTK